MKPKGTNIWVSLSGTQPTATNVTPPSNQPTDMITDDAHVGASPSMVDEATSNGPGPKANDGTT